MLWEIEAKCNMLREHNPFTERLKYVSLSVTQKTGIVLALLWLSPACSNRYTPYYNPNQNASLPEPSLPLSPPINYQGSLPTNTLNSEQATSGNSDNNVEATSLSPSESISTQNGQPMQVSAKFTWIACDVSLIAHFSNGSTLKLPAMVQKFAIDTISHSVFSYDSKSQSFHKWANLTYNDERIRTESDEAKERIWIQIDRRSLFLKSNVFDKAKNTRVVIEGPCHKIEPQPVYEQQQF